MIINNYWLWFKISETGFTLFRLFLWRKNLVPTMSAIPLCSRVSDGLQCPACKKSCIVKNGSTKTGKQQYYCKICTRRFIAFYTYNAYQPTVDSSIVILTKEGLGIRSIARYLGISCTTVLKRLLKIAGRLTAPVTFSNGTYEVDELHTYIGNKSQAAWI